MQELRKIEKDYDKRGRESVGIRGPQQSTLSGKVTPMNQAFAEARSLL